MGTPPADRERHWGPAVTRLCAHLGIPLPEPMTAAEHAEWERRQDETDQQILALYGPDTAAA